MRETDIFKRCTGERECIIHHVSCINESRHEWDCKNLKCFWRKSSACNPRDWWVFNVWAKTQVLQRFVIRMRETDMSVSAECRKCVAFVQFCGRGCVFIFMCVWHKNTHRCARTKTHSHWCMPLVYAGWVSKQRTCRRQGTLSAARCIARVVCALCARVHTCMQGVCYCVCSHVCRRLYVDVCIFVWIHITNQLCFLFF